MATLYIIPGFLEHGRMKHYQALARSFRKKRHTVVLISITWKYRTMNNYVEEFLSQLKHSDGERISVFGFSFGAMIAFLTAPFLKPHQLYLCSLSPYFKEDLSKVTRLDYRMLGKKRFSNFKIISFREIVSQIRCHVTLIVGGQEPLVVQQRFREARKTIRGNRSLIIPGAKHDLSIAPYLSTLCKWIETDVI